MVIPLTLMVPPKFLLGLRGKNKLLCKIKLDIFGKKLPNFNIKMEKRGKINFSLSIFKN